MKILNVSAVVFAIALSANAQSAFQASLVPEVAIHSKDTRINGVALSIWGENPQSALALGLVNGSTGESKGLTISAANYADSYSGVALGFVNVCQENFTGWQGGFVNCAWGNFTGLQSGPVNIAEKFDGLQLGVYNFTETLHGVQIGIINIALNNPWFSEFSDKLAPGFPIVNWSF